MFIKYNSISQNMKNADIRKLTSSLSNISYLPSFYDIPHPFLASLPISTFFLHYSSSAHVCKILCVLITQKQWKKQRQRGQREPVSVQYLYLLSQIVSLQCCRKIMLNCIWPLQFTVLLFPLLFWSELQKKKDQMFGKLNLVSSWSLTLCSLKATFSRNLHEFPLTRSSNVLLNKIW